MKGWSAAAGEAAGWTRKACMRTGESAAVRTGEAATAVRSATMLRKRFAAEPGNHHRDRSETLHADILRPFGKLRGGEETGVRGGFRLGTVRPRECQMSALPCSHQLRIGPERPYGEHSCGLLVTDEKLLCLANRKIDEVDSGN